MGLNKNVKYKYEGPGKHSRSELERIIAYHEGKLFPDVLVSFSELLPILAKVQVGMIRETEQKQAEEISQKIRSLISEIPVK